MSLTITLADELTERLRVQAEARHLSVEHWALVILANASERANHPESWTELNERRLALIRQRYTSGLNAQAEQELNQLQNAAAQVFEPIDRRRLDHLQTLVQPSDGPTDE